MRGYRAVLRGPFLRTWVALLVSRFGANAGFIGLLWLAAQHGGGTTAVGVLTAALALPAVASGPFWGIVLDRMPRPLAIAMDNGLRALLYAVLAIIAAGSRFSLPAATVLVGLGSLLSPLSQAGIRTLVPDLVDQQNLGRANAAVTSLWQVGLLVGPAVGGFLTARYGAVVPIWLQAAGYAVTAALMLTVRAPRTRSAEQPSPWAGIRLLWRAADVRAITLFSLAFSLAYAPLEVVLPRFVSRDLHQNAAAYGTLWVVLAGGALVGSALAGSLTRLRRFGLWLTADFLCWGAAQAALGAARTLITALLAMGAGGLVYGPYETWTATYIQKAVRPSLLGRVFGAYAAVLGAGLPLGALAAAAIAPVSGSRWLLIVSGAANVGLAAVALALPLMRRLSTLHLGERDLDPAQAD